MDELDAIRSFRAAVPVRDESAKHRGRTRLLECIDAPRLNGRPGRRPLLATSKRVAGRRWSRLAMVTVLVAVAGLTAASAFALYFIAGRPAPRAVADVLVTEGEAERLGPVFAVENIDADSARGVAAVDTAAGRAILWTADAEGAVCYFLEFERLSDQAGRPHGETNCGAQLSLGAPMVFVLHREQVRGQKVAVIVGWTHESVASVTLRLARGAERELPISERFFLADVPPAQIPSSGSAGDEPILIARDGGGAELERLHVNDFSGGFFRNPKVGPESTVIDATDTTGQPLRLSTFPTEAGHTCVRVKTRSGTSTGCNDRPRIDSGISVHPTLSGAMVYLGGSVGPEVATLELHHQDGHVIELPITDRFVLYDIPRERFREGKRPALLVGRGREGGEVERMKVRRSLFDHAEVNIRRGNLTG